MKVKELIAKLQEFDPEMPVITRMWSTYMDLEEPTTLRVFKHKTISSYYEHFHPIQWRCAEYPLREEPPETFVAVYFDGN